MFFVAMLQDCLSLLLLTHAEECCVVILLIACAV